MPESAAHDVCGNGIRFSSPSESHGAFDKEAYLGAHTLPLPRPERPMEISQLQSGWVGPGRVVGRWSCFSNGSNSILPIKHFYGPSDNAVKPRFGFPSVFTCCWDCEKTTGDWEESLQHFADFERERF